MKRLWEYKHIRRLIKLAMLLFLLFSMITLVSKFYTKLYVNNKQLELCTVARENNAYNSPVCFFKDNYSYAKLELDRLNDGGGDEQICKDEYTKEEMEADTFIDTDKDGIPDSCDVCPEGNNKDDADQDEVPDECDICPGGNDQIDTDKDGIPDDCDICPGGNDKKDSDHDGVPNGCDVCPNADDQKDENNNGVPDDCEGFSLFKHKPDFESVTPKFKADNDTRKDELYNENATNKDATNEDATSEETDK